MRLAVEHVRIGIVAFLLAAGCACQTAQKPATLLPPGSAPSLHPAAQAQTQPAQPVAAQISEAPQEAQKQDSPKTETSAAPASDPIADLIARVEKDYQAGLDNYRNGKKEEAKQNFDRAMNALLESNFDVRSDERLQKEFDRVVQGVNDIYPGGTDAGAQQADAQQDQQQKSEPAPIDETNQLAPSADARTKAKAEAEIKSTRSDLPLMMTDQVAGYIAYFQGYGRGVFERALSRSGRYHDMIVATLKDQGLPQDLIYLAQAESGFHPHAVSRAGARGIWQFMADRGRGYGLHHNMWVDDRQDPVKSTRAAARHLKDLYAQFGDWYLAMAAYNSGPGTVQAAVKRTGYADFWELYRRNVLPKETRNYVPIILAVTIMAKNPSQYGLENVVMERPPDDDTVTLDYPVDLRLVAQCTNSTVAELQDLNPGLLRLSTPRDGKFELHIPAGTRDDYEATIASIPADKRLWWRYHTVRAGDTVVSLAHTYRVTARSITEANHLDSTHLEADSRIMIPLAAGQLSSSDRATYARHITRYKVHRGDTVESVAENFGVSAQQLRRWNGIRGNSLAGRKVLALHVPISPSSQDEEAASSRTKHSKTETATVKPPATKSASVEHIRTAEVRAEKPAVVHHKVRSGETLASIAGLYKTTVSALRRENRNVAVLRPGMILTIQLAR